MMTTDNSIKDQLSLFTQFVSNVFSAEKLKDPF